MSHRVFSKKKVQRSMSLRVIGDKVLKAFDISLKDFFSEGFEAEDYQQKKSSLKMIFFLQYN